MVSEEKITLSSKIKQGYYSLEKKTVDFFAESVAKKSFLNNLFLLLTIALFVATSGYSATEFFFSNKVVAFLYIGLFACSLVYFAINLPVFKLNIDTIKKHLSLKNIFVFASILFFFISMIATSFKNNNLNGVFRFSFVFVSCVLIASTTSFKRISRLFCKTLLFICLLSLPLYFLAFCLGAEGSNHFSLTDNNALIYSYNYLSFFVNKWFTYHNGQSSLLRLAGPFWEPSIFAALLVLGLVMLCLSDIRKKILYYIAFGLCLVLTFSTGGYFVALLIIPLVFSIKIENKTKKTIAVIASLGAIGVLTILFLGPLMPLLIKMFPTLFSKFQDGVENVRFISVFYLFEVFLKSPLFGFGINGARIQYVSMFPAGTIDKSITSTYAFLPAAFGISGLLLLLIFVISPLFSKSKSIYTNITVALILLVLMNLQNMLMISSVILVLVVLAKDGLYGEANLVESFSCSPRLIDKFLNKSERGIASKNMLGLLVIKGISMFIGIFTIPVYNSFFATDELYGTWAVVISVLSWTLLLDFGFGSGLRVRFADAIDKNDETLKRKLVSSTYIGSLVASLSIFIISLFLIWFLDLNKIMGIPEIVVLPQTLKISMSILAFGLCFEFVLKNIVFLYYAEKKTVFGASFALITNFLLIVVFSLCKSLFENNKLLAASIIYLLCVNIPLIFGSLFYFLKKDKIHLRPSFKFFDFPTCKSVMSFGIAFFLIQIGFMLIFRTDSVFISYLFGPTSASDFSKYYKIFSFFIGLMGAVVQQPIWSAIASSVNKKKFSDIKKFTFITLSISLILFVMCLISGLILQPIFDLWLGSNSISVELKIIISFIIYSFIILIADALIIVANALKLLKVQAITTLVGGIVKILFVILTHNIPSLQSFGWSLLIVVDALCYIPLIIFLPISIKIKRKRLSEKTELKHD